MQRAGLPRLPTRVAQRRLIRVYLGAIATIDEHGRLEPHADGTTTLHVLLGSQQITTSVSVTGIHNPEPVSFRNEIIPALTKSGCNSGGCHGKAEGQNGFRLSIFGFDADADYAALVKESRGRRVLLAAPAESLLLRKGTDAHGT